MSYTPSVIRVGLRSHDFAWTTGSSDFNFPVAVTDWTRVQIVRLIDLGASSSAFDSATHTAYAISNTQFRCRGSSGSFTFRLQYVEYL